MSRRFAFLVLVMLPAVLLAEEPPCQSGPQPGQRPGPYSAYQATGPERGKQHCYICEAGDRPVVIIFARSMSDPLGRLLVQVDRAAAQPAHKDLRAWATFLSDDQPGLDPQLVEWSRRIGLRQLPLGVFEDRLGPPAYRLSADADVTVLLAVNQKVVANFAFCKGELTEEKVKDVLSALPRITGAKP
jgi:hypothetical protein